MNLILQQLQQGLMDGCRQLHNGETMEIMMSPEVDANAVEGIRNAIETLYRSMFQEDLQIDSMKRNEHGVLQISVVRKTDDTDLVG